MRQPCRFTNASVKLLKSSCRNFKGFCPVWIHESDYKLQSFPYNSTLHHSARGTIYPGKKNWINIFEPLSEALGVGVGGGGVSRSKGHRLHFRDVKNLRGGRLKCTFRLHLRMRCVSRAEPLRS